jgi:hypothetical protein
LSKLFDTAISRQSAKDVERRVEQSLRASSRYGTIVIARVIVKLTLEGEMKALIGCAAIIFALATVTSVEAKGCLKGAAVGGVAGHFAGHHGVLGAAAGCVVGRHEANKRDKMQTNQSIQTNRELREEEERF